MFKTHFTRRLLLRAGAAAMLLLPAGLPLAQAQAQVAVGESDAVIADLISGVAEPLPPISDPDFANFIDQHADAKVILLGEASHGTDEFYRARTEITERLVREHGFTVVAVEADWPDAARVDAYVRAHEPLPSAAAPLPRFPVWMWRNQAVIDLIDRLQVINQEVDDPAEQVGFYGLDLYSLPSSMDAVVEFAARHDPEILEEVRARYGCLAPWVDDPVSYGALARGSDLDSCDEEVTSVIEEVLTTRLGEIQASDRAVFDALMNARVVDASEAYYRAMHEGSVASWNLRDTHMFETLQRVLEARGPDAKAVVWAHNSHIGDARATGMGARGEHNLGQLAREAWGDEAVLIGFGTHEGTVTAASDWNGAQETMQVNPSLPGSWELLMQSVEPDNFFLDLRDLPEPLWEALSRERIERFIGVIYRPETEIFSHYVPAALARQFDGYVWFEETQAVEPLSVEELAELPEEHPFAP